jgi:hypothetical protein
VGEALRAEVRQGQAHALFEPSTAVACAQRRCPARLAGAISQRSQGGHDVALGCHGLLALRLFAFVVHESSAERARCFVLIVCTTAQAHVIRRCLTTARHRGDMVELERLACGTLLTV